MPDQREELVRKMIAEGTSDDDIRATLKAYDAQVKPTASGGMLQTAKDVGIGALKGLGSTLANVAETMGNAGALPGVMPSGLSNEFRNPAFQKAEEATTASNSAQRAGKIAEGVAEIAVPVGGAVNAIPRTARASRNFAKVAKVANGVPLGVEGPGQVALRIQQLAERGGTEPRVVSKFLRRVTDPAKEGMNFEEGRDFYSNISRLSADEYNRLTPVMQREVGNLRTALNSSLQDAAGAVGQGDRYAGAMKEYAQAAKMNSFKDALVQALTRKALPAGAAGAGAGGVYWLGQKLLGLAGDE